jgi:TrmH family RNA methyltransferase
MEANTRKHKNLLLSKSPDSSAMQRFNYAKLVNMGMISKKQEKLIRSLHQKKFRKQHQLYIIEGEKLLNEAIASGQNIEAVFATEMQATALDLKTFTLVEKAKMKQLSSLKTPPGVVAILKQQNTLMPRNAKLVLALDGIKDPGNLGTIIRTADAFQVDAIVCSEDSVDVYSPKVVQATMGSLFRIPVCQIDLKEYFKELNSYFKYGLYLKGNSLYKEKFKHPAVLVMGSESHGISKEIEASLDRKLTIPMNEKVESLNVSTATAVTLSEFQRQALRL